MTFNFIFSMFCVACAILIMGSFLALLIFLTIDSIKRKTEPWWHTMIYVIGVILMTWVTIFTVKSFICIIILG